MCIQHTHFIHIYRAQHFIYHFQVILCDLKQCVACLSLFSVSNIWKLHLVPEHLLFNVYSIQIFLLNKFVKISVFGFAFSWIAIQLKKYVFLFFEYDFNWKPMNFSLCLGWSISNLCAIAVSWIVTLRLMGELLTVVPLFGDFSVSKSQFYNDVETIKIKATTTRNLSIDAEKNTRKK